MGAMVPEGSSGRGISVALKETLPPFILWGNAVQGEPAREPLSAFEKHPRFSYA